MGEARSKKMNMDGGCVLKKVFSGVYALLSLKSKTDEQMQPRPGVLQAQQIQAVLQDMIREGTIALLGIAFARLKTGDIFDILKDKSRFR